MTLTAHRGAILHFLGDPGQSCDARSYEYLEDGLLLVESGKIARLGPAPELLRTLPSGLDLIDHGRRLVIPGLIDTHIHYPQTDIIGSAGHDLLEWLREYTFPAEQRFSDYTYARAVAELFLDELARNGTTTALVFCTVHPASVTAFFEAAAARNLRMIAGKVLMDRHCPELLRDTAPSGARESRELLQRWHQHGRLLYALAPRFAATSSAEQLTAVSQLAREFPDVFIHSHAAENRDEVAWVQRLYPEARSYLDVYDRYGLLRRRAIYAHCIHVDRADRERMAQTGAAAAFCPSSNLYLGSGLFDIAAADAAGMLFSIATDVGGGNHFSLLRTLGDAYKVAQLSGQSFSPLRALYLMTLGAARALGLEANIGSFSAGREADFIELDLEATPLLARRTGQARTLQEKLQALIALADDRAVAATYILGERVYAAA